MEVLIGRKGGACNGTTPASPSRSAAAAANRGSAANGNPASPSRSAAAGSLSSRIIGASSSAAKRPCTVADVKAGAAPPKRSKKAGPKGPGRMEVDVVVDFARADSKDRVPMEVEEAIPQQQGQGQAATRG